MFEIDFYTQTENSIIQKANDRVLQSNEEWEKPVWQFVVDWYNPAIETITIFTSGSTGKPKEIQHTKQAMLNSAAMTCKALNLEQGNKALLCLPVNKIAGMMMVVRSIYQKMKLVCVKPSTTPLLHLSDYRAINFAAFTPMQFYGITNNSSCFASANGIDKIILGGEDVRPELMNQIHKLQSEVYITFGMTETISHIALKRLNGSSTDNNFKTLPGIDIGVDERNCLVINAPLLIQPNLVTNDVVEILSKNEFRWLGRIDNVINTGGVKIYPEEVEQQLAKAIEIPFFITSKSDEHSGEKLVLVLEKDNLQLKEKEELLKAINQLPKLQRPKEILLVLAFTRTANGKIKRNESVVNPVEIIRL